MDPISFRDFLSFDSCIVRFDDLCAKLWYVLRGLVSCVFGISKVLAPSSHAFCCHAFCVHSNIFVDVKFSFSEVLERGCWPQSDDTGSLVWICELFFPQEDFN